MPPLAQELIRIKRDGGALTAAQIAHFVQGLADGGWSEGQAAAMAMAILLRGMDRAETVALTQSMTRSGEVLDWHGAGLQGPVLDKHSTGGVGDKVSLVLAPIVAACGAVVPMVSGRALSHTGGTLDKLEALPGYGTEPTRSVLLSTLRTAGCAIVGASAQLAPADRRLYAIRDVTATVESVPLITASILSKKLAAGLQGLVMDVKFGNGAFTPSLEQARLLARSLVDTAQGAGLPTVALLSDMNQPLGTTAGNALETAEAIDFLTGRAREPRLLELTLTLGAQLVLLGGICATLADAERRVRQVLDSGEAAERFARMVAQLGGPHDVLHDAQLPRSPLQRDWLAPRAGFIAAIDTRAVGLAVVALGGGRRRSGDRIDPSVGLSALLPLGTAVHVGQALAQIHAASEAAADEAAAALAAAYQIGDEAPTSTPVALERIGGIA